MTEIEWSAYLFGIKLSLMAEKSNNLSNLPIISAVGLVIACAGVGWGFTTSDTCSACNATLPAVGHDILLTAGAVFYPALLLLISFDKTQTLACYLIALAAGVHLILIKLLIDADLACIPCFVTATGAFLAFLSIMLGRPSKRFSMLSASALTAVAGLVLLVLFVVPEAEVKNENELPQEYLALLEDAKSVCQRNQSQTCIVIFERSGCAACNVLKEKSERERLEEVSGGKINITRRTADNDVSVPTVAVIHKGQWSVFIGSPTNQQLDNLFSK